MRILLTRPERPAAHTAAALEALGHEVLSDPLLTIVRNPIGPLVAGGLPDALAATSANGIRGLAGHPDLPRLAALPCFTVGARTAAAARELGFTDVRPADGDGAALARLLASSLPPGARVLEIAAEQRAVDLAALLAPAGIRVGTVVAYRAEPAEHLAPATIAALTAGTLDAVAHFSRRTTESFLRLAVAGGVAGQALALRHACLSANVAEPLKAVGAARLRIAAAPDEASLVAVFTDWR